MTIKGLLKLGVASLGWALQAAQGATVPTAVDDLILGFRASSGVGAGQNLEVNLGSVSQFVTASGPVSVTRLAASDLSTIYGATWNSRLGTTLFWGVIGSAGRTASGPNGQPASTLWATAIQASSGSSTPWPRKVGTLQNNGSVKIEGIYSGAAASLDASTALSSNAFSASVDASTTGSWSIQRGSTSSAFSFLSPATQFDSPSPVSVYVFS